MLFIREFLTPPSLPLAAACVTATELYISYAELDRIMLSTGRALLF